jgi:hypothetical protein
MIPDRYLKKENWEDNEQLRLWREAQAREAQARIVAKALRAHWTLEKLFPSE